MKILKTSEQAQKEKQQKDTAFKQSLVCPECETKTRSRDRILVYSTGGGNIYKCECKKCGCVCETDTW